MKTSITILVGLAMATVAVTVASAQDARYSTKPWLHSRQLKTATKATAATDATPGATAQAYSTKPWLTPRTEFQIAVLAEGGKATASKPVTRPERVANPKDYSTKPWLR